MKILDYLYYRIYREYMLKNDSPKLRAFCYLTLLLFYISIIITLFVEKIGKKLGLFDISSSIKNPLIWIVIIFLNGLFIYILYTNKTNHVYHENLKYAKYIKLWMLILLPFLILFGGIIIYILVFGGWILSHRIN